MERVNFVKLAKCYFDLNFRFVKTVYVPPGKFRSIGSTKCLQFYLLPTSFLMLILLLIIIIIISVQ